MAKIVDTRICSKCNTEYTWDYHIPNKSTDKYFDVEEVNVKNAHATRMGIDKHNNFYTFKNICPNCRQLDVFDYEHKPKI